VTTRLRCGEIFSDHFIEHLSLGATAKKIFNIGLYLELGRNLAAYVFGPPCIPVNHMLLLHVPVAYIQACLTCVYANRSVVFADRARSEACGNCKKIFR